jgi:hypothetical protein
VLDDRILREIAGSGGRLTAKDRDDVVAIGKRRQGREGPRPVQTDLPAIVRPADQTPADQTPAAPAAPAAPATKPPDASILFDGSDLSDEDRAMLRACGWVGIGV